MNLQYHIDIWKDWNNNHPYYQKQTYGIPRKKVRRLSSNVINIKKEASYNLNKVININKTKVSRIKKSSVKNIDEELIFFKPKNH